MTALRYGIVGYGWAGSMHYRILSKMRRLVRIVGVCDCDGAALGACPAPGFSCFDELLSEDLDAVSICTPHACHAPQASAALERGVACLVEKPLATTPGACRRLMRLAAARATPLGVVAQHRFDPLMLELAGAVRRGELGELVGVDIDLKWHKEPSYYRGWKGSRAQAGGGVVLMQAIHMLDIAQMLAGPARAVAARFCRFTPEIDVEDNAFAVLEYTDGVCGTLRASTTTHPWHGTSLHVMGRRGYVLIHDGRVVHWGGRSPLAIARMNLAARARQAAAVGRPYFGPGHAYQLRAFVEAVRSGAAAPVDPSEGYSVVRLIEALERSSAEGRWVEVG